MTNLQLLLIDISPIVRLGLRAVFADYSDLQVVAEMESGNDTGNVVNTIEALGKENYPDLVIWDLDIQKFVLANSDRNAGKYLLCQQLKAQYPNLPILLLTELQLNTFLASAFLARAKQSGADGYCSKNLAVTEFVAAIRQVASGKNYWPEEVEAESSEGERKVVGKVSIHRKLINEISGSGMQQIEQAISELNQQLQDARLLQKEDLTSLVDWLFLTGRRRELLAARWLVSQLLRTGKGQDDLNQKRINFVKSTDLSLPIKQVSPVVSSLQLSLNSLATNNLQAVLFDTAAARLQSSLVNLTGETLEIDIFRLTKKRELILLKR